MAKKTLTFKIDENPPEEVFCFGIRDGKLFVKGDLDKGAKLFFEQIIKPMADKYIKEQIRNG